MLRESGCPIATLTNPKSSKTGNRCFMVFGELVHHRNTLKLPLACEEKHQENPIPELMGNPESGKPEIREA